MVRIEEGLSAPGASGDEAAELRRCVRELAALSTLSAAWSGGDWGEIAEGLCQVLERAVAGTVAYVRVAPPGLREPVEVARSERGRLSPAEVRAIGDALAPALWSPGAERAAVVTDPSGGGSLRVLSVPLGYNGACGVVAVGSPRPAFPTQTDRLLVGVAANQAAIVLQQKQSEAQLRRSERELGDFFENATVGLHWVGPEGTILRVNRAELAMLGYSAEEYVGRNIAEFHADPDVIADILARLWEGREVRDYEARMVGKDGAIRYVLIDSSVLWEDGRFVHTRCFTRDITERRLAEAGRARMASIVESSDDAILSIDGEGVITSWNRGAERIYGYAAAEAVGRHVSMLIPPERPDDLPLIMDRLRRGDRIEHYETERVARGGTRVDVSLTISAIRDAAGAIVGASKIARDITERKRTAAALRVQTERLRLLWEAAAVLLTAEDPETMLRRLLARIGPHLGVEAYFSYALDEAGQTLRLASWDGVGDAPPSLLAGLDFGQQALVEGRAEPMVGGPVPADGGPAARALQALGLRAFAGHPLQASGRLLGALVFASKSKDRFDTAEVAFMRTVCHYVTVAYERLRLLGQLTEADRRKDEFLAVLAHELRNPLAPVRNAVQVLRMKGPDDPELRWARDVIQRQVDHLTRLIDDLMDVSRITRDNLQLCEERIELADVIRSAVESSRPAIEKGSHVLTVTLPPRPVHLTGDLVRLAQVFLNLLNNAAKYTEPGGRIWLSAEADDEEVVVRVKDNGVGIPPDKLPRLFQMFFQVDRTLDRAQGGLGIGLALVRRLVELHGGRVEARSEGLGKGSEFVVHLPTSRETAAESVARAPAGAAAAAAGDAVRRILIVDDNRDSADSLAMMLRLAGNEVETAYDGEEGVRAAERFRPHVGLLDIGMPRLNGEEACRRIRAKPWGADVMLIALTGWGQEDDRRRTVEAGFDAHVVKPVDPAVLLDLLARAPGRAGRAAADAGH